MVIMAVAMAHGSGEFGSLALGLGGRRAVSEAVAEEEEPAEVRAVQPLEAVFPVVQAVAVEEEAAGEMAEKVDWAGSVEVPLLLSSSTMPQSPSVTPR